MKKLKEQKQAVVAKDEQIPKKLKSSACCGPTCCGNSNKKNNVKGKEK
ncbi:MAG: hypothetical protein IH620_06110 [Ignavibacterium sp.]|nr:hypothetical protein [Ignavibacterium sp.]